METCSLSQNEPSGILHEPATHCGVWMWGRTTGRNSAAPLDSHRAAWVALGRFLAAVSGGLTKSGSSDADLHRLFSSFLGVGPRT